MRAKKILDEYSSLGNSKQHTENCDISKAFLDIINNKNKLDESGDSDLDKKVALAIRKDIEKLPMRRISSLVKKMTPEGQKDFKMKIETLSELLGDLDDLISAYEI